MMDDTMAKDMLCFVFTSLLLHPSDPDNPKRCVWGAKVTPYLTPDSTTPTCGHPHPKTHQK
jgi:hypothetical protein